MEINPTIINVESLNIRMKAKFAKLNKQGSMKDYQEEIDKGESEYYVNDCKVMEIAHFTDAELEEFKYQFLTNFEFLVGKGGTDSDYDTDYKDVYELLNDKPEFEKWKKQSYDEVILCKSDNDSKGFLVNPEGHNYARYVGIF